MWTVCEKKKLQKAIMCLRIKKKGFDWRILYIYFLRDPIAPFVSANYFIHIEGKYKMCGIRSA